MGNNTNSSGAIGTVSIGGRRRGPGGPIMAATVHTVTVEFSMWGPEDGIVQASSGGGRGGRPYLVVTVGPCLTYLYAVVALDCYLAAWREAATVARAVRLTDLRPAGADRRHLGEDLGVVCTVEERQTYNVTSSTDAKGRAAVHVRVGAVTVHAHTLSAVRSHLAAWVQADTARDFLRHSADTR